MTRPHVRTPLAITLALVTPAFACVPHDTMEDPEPPAPMPEGYSAGDEQEAKPAGPEADAAEPGARL
jgi:hypothetical protein